ncbi:uncharacterized protein LOC114533190 [Dendronephthya gigantea]|uniref:uncharacterized protein LOC114533190 n=1 Tax=Dendronephthya gigantea TaxID=151771 RepID=UPI00106CBBB0|nr:uncharacterized protein LOC114533190 [Dendronephthya gigantea]
MNKIKEEFVKTVAQVEDTDASHYRTYLLKKRLQVKFPELVFYLPKMRRKSEIVYAESLSQGAVAEAYLDDENQTLETEMDIEDDDLHDEIKNQCDKTATLTEIYNVALTLRNILRCSTQKWYKNWPPLASDITVESIAKLVSPLLFNFMTWLLGFSDIPEVSEYVEVDEKNAAKVFTICQDLIYVSSKGKTQTPKSLALAMAVRQISGCSSLINILNGLGHCVSLSSTMAYDSALAQSTMNTSDIIPKEFVANKYVNLVYDNIDFGEEITKQTHVTNGIITQKLAVQSEDRLQHQHAVEIKKTQRTVKIQTSEIAPYNLRVKVTPTFRESAEDINERSYETAQKLDLAYVLTKMVCANDETPMPGWTGFNTMLHDEIPDVSRVGYLPVIDATPTEYSTINEILKRSMDIAETLHLTYAVLVFDEAVYSKVQHIRWKEPAYYDKFVVRLGEFHTIMSFLSGVSKIFEDGGLKDIFIESGVVTEGSVKGVLSGKHYNRSVFCHKIVHEAMQRLRFDAFLDSLDEEKEERFMGFIRDMSDSFPEQNFHEHIENEVFEKICNEYESFVEDASNKSRTFAFWSMYIKVIGILLTFIRATRQINWKLHLAAFRAMIPWFFASDRVNYARYGSAYWLEMMSLERTHPGILPDLSSNFAVQRQSNYGFSAVACDQTIEQTANRDSKTKGGLIGFSMNRAAVHRWLLSQSERAAITNKCKYMAGMECKPRKRKDLDETKCRRYETSVHNVMSTVSQMVNPFEVQQEELTSLASGVVLETIAADQLLNAEKLGEKQFAEFSRKKLFSDEPDIFAKLERNKLQTFSSSRKTTGKESKGKEINTKMNRNFFARLLVIAKSREIDLKEVLSYSLGAYPLSLATPTGGLVKTAKSKLFEIVESKAGNPEVDIRNFHNNALIVDAMAVLQVMKGKWKTFGELADSIFAILIKLARQCNATRLDFVADRYPVVSIKNTERGRRAEKGVQRIRIFGKDQPIPKQWKKFMSCGENKESLMSFLSEHWRTYQSSQLAGVSTMYVTCKEKCFVLSCCTSESNPVLSLHCGALESNHEEADTRLLLHAKHAMDTNDAVIIKSPDTDVFLLCTAMQSSLGSKDLFMMTGTGSKCRTIHVNEVSNALGREFCRCLLGFHAFSGSDCTSSFYGKGKVKAWKTLIDNPRFFETFSTLGSNFPPTEALVSELNEFTCLLYGDKVSTSVNDCRYTLFKAGKCSDEVLPPTCDSLLKHIERVNYQTGVWSRCLTAQLVIPSPIGNGWQLSNGEIEIVWMTRPSAPDSLLNCVYCHCKTGCKTKRCSCQKANLICTDLCSCVDCVNVAASAGEEGDSCDEDDTDIETTDVEFDSSDEF